VGRRCRQAPIKDIAHELGLDWDTVKSLEMQYMRAQLAKAGTPAPKVIGVDEIAIRKGHTYRIVVSRRLCNDAPEIAASQNSAITCHPCFAA
jgi:transposase